MTLTATISSLRGRRAFKQQTVDALTQEDVIKILTETQGELNQVWIRVQYLDKRVPEAEYRNLENKYLQYDHSCGTQKGMNDEDNPSPDLIIENHKAAVTLRKSVRALGQEVLSTSKRVNGLSSTTDVSVVNDTPEELEDQESAPWLGRLISMVFKPNKHTNPSQKPSKNTRRPTISKPASPPCPNTSTSSSETPSPERPIVSQENMRCELEVGFETETSRVVFVDHRENLDKPEWIEPVGKALESQMPGQLVKVGRRFSRDSGAFSIASHEHYERYDEIEPDN